MRKSILAVFAAALFAITACQKSTESNKNVLMEDPAGSGIQEGKSDSLAAISGDESAVKTGEYTERYVAEDGSSALVTFKNTDEENSISVRSNNKTITAPRKADAEPGVYADFDFEIVSRNDSVIITQGNSVIGLKKARGQ